MFFQHRYVAWAYEQQRHAQLRIALDIIEKCCHGSSVNTPKTYEST